MSEKSNRENIPKPNPKQLAAFRAQMAELSPDNPRAPENISFIKIGSCEIRVWANQRYTFVKVSSDSNDINETNNVVAILEMAFGQKVAQRATLKNQDTLKMDSDHTNYGNGKDCTEKNIKEICQELSLRDYGSLVIEAGDYAQAQLLQKTQQEKSWCDAHENAAKAEMQPHVDTAARYLAQIGKALSGEEINGLRDALVQNKVRQR